MADTPLLAVNERRTTKAAMISPLILIGVLAAISIDAAVICSKKPHPQPPSASSATVTGTAISIVPLPTVGPTPQCKLTLPKQVLNATIALIDDHLPILVSNPVKDIRLSTKSRYPIPADAPAKPVCEVVQVQMVARHGTRNPSNGDVTKQIALQKKLSKTVPTNPKFAFLSTFDPPATLETASLLSLQGAKDHQLLSKRIKAAYPNLVSDPTLISWQASNVSRAIASGNYFIDSLFDSNKVKEEAKAFLAAAVVPQAIDADLRPYDACANYINASEAATAAAPEKVFARARFPPIAVRVSELVGIPGLTYDDVTTLFNLCSFDIGLQGKVDGFCSMFTDEEFALYDFQADLKNNADEGYDLTINEKLACSLFTTLSNNMDSIIDKSCAAPKAVFRFAHEETILPIITGLGLFRDSYPLTPTSTEAEIANRKFKFSKMSPMAGNIIFELLKCSETGYRVRVLVNEVPVLLPGCSEEACPIETFKGVVMKGKVGCDFDGEVCGNTYASVGSSATFKALAEMPIGLVLDAVQRSA
ncbi:PHOsphatase [Dinochytrium kinnereticum]|nr:PHOsphatase [Dinochytrium kinnereticum]